MTTKALTVSVFFILMISGCVFGIEAYRHPLFIPAYQKKILRTSGQFRTIHSFDCNGDGYSDLLLVGIHDICCYLGTNNGLEEHPRYHWRFPEIRYFDFIPAIGVKKAHMLVVTKKKILYFDDFENKNANSIDEIEAAYFPPLGRLRLFQNLDSEHEADIVIPFCSRSRKGWFARLYSLKNGSGDFRGEIYLGGMQKLFPPKVYLWRNGKILVESIASLWMYLPNKRGYYVHPAQVIKWPRILLKKNIHLKLAGIAQLNREANPELVLAQANVGKMWVWVDQNLLYPLTTSDILNLGIDFKDYNRDGWNDIVCIALKKITFGQMIPYIASNKVPVTLKIYVFYNDRGHFSPKRHIVFERKLWVVLKNTNTGDFAVQLMGDMDNDGLLDGISLNQLGKLQYYYNIFGFLPEQRPIDWFDKLLKPIYKRIVFNHWPRRAPDFSMQLPNLENYRKVSVAVLSSHGENASLVFHYRAIAPDYDLLVVVFPNGKIKYSNERQF